MTKIDYNNIENDRSTYDKESCELATKIDQCFTGQPRGVCLSALELNIMNIIKLSTQDINYNSTNKFALHQWLDLFNENILNIIEEA